MENFEPLSVTEWFVRAIAFLRGEACVDETCVEGALIVRSPEPPLLRDASTDSKGDHP
jgi:hypothetical protein